LTKHPGEEGSSRGLILSLMVDHSLLFHPAQLARIENKLPAFTVGSLAEKIKVEGLLSTFKNIIMSDTPTPFERFKEFAKALEKDVIHLYPSKKHMVNRDLGKLEATTTLKHRRAA